MKTSISYALKPQIKFISTLPIGLDTNCFNFKTLETKTGFLPQDSKHYVSKVIGSKREVFRSIDIDTDFLSHVKYLYFMTREDDQSYLNVLDMQF